VAKTRTKIPVRIENEILFRADHTCCICRSKGKDVQIHHIDWNTSNNKPGNLIVVCLDCHSKITGRRGLGKSYKTGELRMYKRSWEQFVQWARKVHKPQIRYQKELISQIDLIVCEILGCRRNSPRTKELLDLLLELHIWRGNHEIDKKIIEGLHHLALMSGLGSPALASLVAEKLWEMCFHFVGPGYVAMTKNGLKQVLDCIQALSTLAEFNCEFGHGRKAIDSITEHGEDFFELGLWYNRRKIVNNVINLYRGALKACYTEGKLDFEYGRRSLRGSIRSLRKLVTEEQPTWSYQLGRLDTLMKINN